MRLTVSIALLALTLSSGCRSSVWSTSIQGEGPHLSLERPIEEFDAISLEGGWTLDVRVGEMTSVEIQADENLHEYIATDVEDGRLRIHFLESVSTSNPLRAVISTPHLHRLSIAGSGKLNVTGVAAQDFSISIAGSGKGSISGHTERLDVSIAGSGNLELYELEADDVSIDIAGSGSVQTNARRSLDVDIAGSGRVRYHGQPEVSVSQSGSGSVRQGD